ncbi:MAG: hypothetical protein ABI569_05890 [Casimicrobiaceae bacterium]
MIARSFRVVFSIVAVGIALATAHPAQANNPSRPLRVEFIDCVESIGVGLAPTANVEALWWQKTRAGNVKMDTLVPVIAVSSADLLLHTHASNAVGRLIGGDTLAFPVVQQFNTFSRARMRVIATP